MILCYLDRPHRNSDLWMKAIRELQENEDEDEKQEVAWNHVELNAFDFARK